MELCAHNTCNLKNTLDTAAIHFTPNSIATDSQQKMCSQNESESEYTASDGNKIANHRAYLVSQMKTLKTKDRTDNIRKSHQESSACIIQNNTMSTSLSWHHKNVSNAETYKKKFEQKEL